MTAGVRVAVRIGGLELANPIMPASGCFGPELGRLIDLDRLGALVTKTIFYEPRSGNPADRITEVGAVMLNSIGIPSPGVEAFVADILPQYLAWQPPTIVSIGGLSVDEYHRVAERLADVEGIGALELNISCPNLEAGGLEIGADPHAVEQVVRGVVERSRVPVIAKLTPNVTSIVEIARASEAGGADAVSAINTLVGMGVDLTTRRPHIGNGTGGVSGPAIKPVALRMVWTVARAVSIPVIGVGGIATAQDALEFLLAGASAVQLGSVNFTHPDAMPRAVEGVEAWLRTQEISDIRDFIGSLKVASIDDDVAGFNDYGARTDGRRAARKSA